LESRISATETKFKYLLSTHFQRPFMPQRVFCSNCGHTLYNGVELESPGETISRLAGSCPRCGKKLDFSISRIRIAPAERA